MLFPRKPNFTLLKNVAFIFSKAKNDNILKSKISDTSASFINVSDKGGILNKNRM